MLVFRGKKKDAIPHLNLSINFLSILLIWVRLYTVWYVVLIIIFGGENIVVVDVIFVERSCCLRSCCVKSFPSIAPFSSLGKNDGRVSAATSISRAEQRERKGRLVTL